MLSPFELHEPTSVDEACRLKRDLGDTATIVAGGTDVFVEMHGGKHRSDHVISLRNVDEMHGIRWSPQTGLDVGSMVTHHELENNTVVRERYPVFFDGVNTIGSLQVRNLATIGGNLCTAAPSADGVPPLMVLNAVCVIHGVDRKRTVPIEEFFVGARKSCLAADELLVRVQVPATSTKYGSAYFKYGRRNAMEIALQGVCAYVEIKEDGHTCREARIALATSAPTPIRAPLTEGFLKGKDLSDPTVLAETGVRIQDEARPRSSWRSSETFRRDLLLKLVPQTVGRAFQEAIKE